MALYFREPLKGIVYDYYEGHGRIETRRYESLSKIDWLKKEHAWPGLKAIGCVESIRENIKSGEISKELRYYIASLAADAVDLLRIICIGPYVTFNKDQCRARKDHGAEFRHIALNLIKLEEGKGSLRCKRKKAG